MTPMMQRFLLWATVIVGSGIPAAEGFGATIDVRYPEGTTHAYLSLLATNGNSVAQGELLQTIKGDRVDSRLVFNFKDGSVHDEGVTFTQDRVFKLWRYELAQRGPSFPEAVEITMDQPTGQYLVRSRAGDRGLERLLEGHLKLPADTYNGMLIMLLKNLNPSEAATVHLVVFTPKPKVIRIKLKPVREETLRIGQHSKKARQYRLEPQLGAVTQFFGRLFGLLPAKDHYYSWILTEDVPAFLHFEGPLYLTGPIWRIELLNPTLPPSLDGASPK